MFKRIGTTLFAIYCGTLLVGCASVPMSSLSADAEAKQFPAKPDKAGVYIYRGGGMGAGIAFQSVLDGRIVGSLAPNTFQYLTVSPGNHTLLVNSNENSKQQNLSARAGSNYFYKVGTAMGWVSARVTMEPVGEVEGRKEVTALNRAEAASY